MNYVCITLDDTNVDVMGWFNLEFLPSRSRFPRQGALVFWEVRVLLAGFWWHHGGLRSLERSDTWQS